MNGINNICVSQDRKTFAYFVGKNLCLAGQKKNICGYRNTE